ncbi:hypothetical protein PMZ80_005531 [Knufia obscura]|uniref:Carbohydrate kinase PfkB domain-containing protein n=2 Tax=Knufia TaxID=430999 RepID=A0AAN8I4I9_9EURO|nr:hypothetical protein PMZ80_005531 [Knufia obscura]KAK5950000.1 hypothetical protein OHC33_008961 [Knufia fluminis]
MSTIKSVSFVTFGMFIIDEIEWQTANPPSPKHNLIGGAGTYAVLGARLAASPCQLLSQSISWIVDIGSDFPPEVKENIDRWNTTCVFRTDTSRLTTRAWNGYGENELRSFKYLTPKVRLEVSSLNQSQLLSKSFHMVCSPQRCLDITTKLEEARRSLKQYQRPHVVWEPIPDLCSPEELLRFQSAAVHCSIVSPNHEEIKMFFAPDFVENASQSDLVSKLMPWNFFETEIDDTASLPVAIVREGANGSTAYLCDAERVSQFHVPAYHTQDMASSVVDPTGGGNTYLGALAIAMTDALYNQASYEKMCIFLAVPSPKSELPQFMQAKRLQNVAIAMIYAVIAASFAIEQNGTPQLKQEKVFTEIVEYWNGDKFNDRLERYLEREGAMIRDQLAPRIP